MRGNKSPAPPVLTAPRGGVLNPKGMKNERFHKEYEQLADEFCLAEKVIKLRQEQNLSQNDLAKIAGTSQPAIARLESGKYQNVSLSFLGGIKNLAVVDQKKRT
jgi:DNA-binding XRE family transcriptional regulator